MNIIYFFTCVLVPWVMLQNITKRTELRSTLLSKTDSQYLRGVAACFVLLVHSYMGMNEMIGGGR